MKICHLSTVHKATDNRIYRKECKSLVKDGYEVHLVASGNLDSDKVIFHQLSDCKGRLKRIIYKQWQAAKILRRIKPDLLHIHDPELLPLALIIKFKTKCRLIFDVHEFYREQIIIKKWIKTTTLKNVISFLYAKIEVKLLSKFDGVILCVPGMQSDYKFHKNTCIVKNSPILCLIADVKMAIVKEERSIIIYPGTLSESRGVFKLIESLEYIKIPAVLWLLGNWQNENEKTSAMNMQQWKNVKYWGRVLPEEVYSLMKRADVGVHLIQPKGQYKLDGIPVKVLEFFAAGVPVVISDIESKRNLFNESVLYVDSTNPKSIAQGLTEILSSKDLKSKFIDNGFSFIKNYSWEKEEQILLNFYENILN